MEPSNDEHESGHVAHVRWATYSAVGLAAVIGLLMLVAYLYVDSTNEGDRRDRDMLEARRSSCLQANAQITRDRIAARNQAGALARALISASQRSGRELDPEVANAFIAGQEGAAFEQAKVDYPYRDCSDRGIAAFFADPPPAAPCEPDGRGYCR